MTQPSKGRNDDVDVAARRVLSDGFFRLFGFTLRYRRFDGRWSRHIEREVLHRGDTTGVLLYDPNRDSVVLVEQFRAAALVHPIRPWLIEVVAGIIDDGEEAAEVARREALEEAGIKIDRLLPICRTFLSPGGLTERINLFCGLVDSDDAGGTHGLEHEGEDTRPIVMAFDEAVHEIGRTIVTAPAIICLQWLSARRVALRDEGGPRNG